MIKKGQIGDLRWEVLDAAPEMQRVGAEVEVRTSMDGGTYRSYHYRSLAQATQYLSLLGVVVLIEGLVEEFCDWWNGDGYDGKSAFVLEVGKAPRIVKPKNGTDFSLKEAQNLVDGYIEVVNIDKGLIAIVDEEGFLKNKENNVKADGCIAYHSGRVTQLCGTVVLCNSSMLK